MEENRNEKLILCKNCGGYYDSAQEQCPHCGEDTAVNTEKKKESVFSIADYGGGFGPRDSVLARGALVLILILLLAALAGVVSVGMNALSALKGSNESNVGAVSSQPVETEDTSLPIEKPVKGENDPDSLSLNYDNISLSAKQSTRLLVTAQPEEWTGELTWTTSNKYVATVDVTGQVTYAGGGECVITVSSGTASVECKVKCSGDAAEKTGKEASVKGAYPVELQPEDSKADSSEQKDDTKAEDEQQKEEETPKEEETQPEDEKEEASASQEITLNWYDITLHKGEGTQLEASGGNGTYTWTSANPSIATVDSTGKVLWVSPGDTTVTCTSGDKTKECIIRAK